MKITTLTAEQLELKEGGTAGIVVGACLAVAGILAGIFMRQLSPFAIWIALALVVAGILVILFSSSITLNANKRSGQLRYQKKRIVGTQDLMYSIADVFRIETRKQWRMQDTPGSGDNQPARQQPVLVAQTVIVFKRWQGTGAQPREDIVHDVNRVGDNDVGAGSAKCHGLAGSAVSKCAVPGNRAAEYERRYQHQHRLQLLKIRAPARLCDFHKFSQGCGFRYMLSMHHHALDMERDRLVDQLNRFPIRGGRRDATRQIWNMRTETSTGFPD